MSATPQPSSETRTGDSGPGARRRRPVRYLAHSVALLLGAGLLALIFYGVTAQAPNTSIDDSLARGQTPAAPTFALAVLQPGTLGPKLMATMRPILAGHAVSLRELRGQRIVLNFWASWCDPCRQEAPLLERAWRAARRRGVLFLGLDMQDIPAEAKGFLRQYGSDYLNVRDPTNAVAQRYGATGLPETFFITPSGRVVDHVIGVSTSEDLRAGIAATATGQPVGARQAGGHRPIG